MDMPFPTLPLAARPFAPPSTPRAAQAAKRTAPRYPAGAVGLLLLATVVILPLLAFVNARGWPVGSGLVGACEALVFVGCIVLLRQHIPAWTLGLALGLMAWLVLAWLVRQQIDLKSARDLMIPLLFVSLGRLVADTEFAERTLRKVTLLVLVVGVAEVLFTTAYGDIFNALSFYGGIGSIRESAAMFDGQTLTLNGFRPEGIGRTLLPALLGSHRASSVFLEPVSLGNFAVILLAWALSRGWKEMDRGSLLLALAALVLIVLSDSRFGMLMVGLLLAFRALPTAWLRVAALVYPLVLLAGIVGVATQPIPDGDNVLGRIALTGQALMQLNEAALLGLDSPLPGFGDMGYAYVLTRFGAIAVLVLVMALFLIPVGSARADRFRALVVVYGFSSLAISGTSVFALKTAGLMWFLVGVLAAAPQLRQATHRQEAACA